MTDPTRYIRKAVINALSATVTVYDRPPSNAVVPYGVIGVTIAQQPVKGVKIYKAQINLTIYNEFREYAGRKAIDELTDGIMDIMVPDNDAYLSVENFNVCGLKLTGTDENSNIDNSLTSIIKVLRFEMIISE